MWSTPSVRAIRYCRKNEEASESTGYCLALACVDPYLGLVALHSAARGSHVDFSLIPSDAEPSSDPDLDLERSDLVLLEVSAIDDDDSAKLRVRLRQKVEQVVASEYDFPGYAAVVGFASAQVVLRKARG